jgi:hypothetical protein
MASWLSTPSQRDKEKPMRLPSFFRNGCARLPSAVYLAIVASIFMYGVSAANRRASLELTPASFPMCQGPNIVAHVRWDARSSTNKPIKIFVHKAGNPPKLWYGGAPAGEADTGKWIADGSTLELTDHKGRLLARRTMETTPCKGS